MEGGDEEGSRGQQRAAGGQCRRMKTIQCPPSVLDHLLWARCQRPGSGEWSVKWGWTTKIESATRPFLKIDRATGPFLKFDIRHGHLSDMRQGYFLTLTCDIGAKIISDMRHGYF